jgi:hypothetical protein
MWNFVSRQAWHKIRTGATANAHANMKAHRIMYTVVTGTGVGIIASPFGVLMYLNL